MLWWLWTSGAVAGGCDPDEPVRRGLQSWLAGDQELARAALEEASAAFGCGPIAEPQTLARYWILDGVVLTAAGDREEAVGSFAAARRVAPDTWLPDLGPELHDAWGAAADPEGEGTIGVLPGSAPGTVWIDGSPSTTPGVAAGLHLVQVGAPDAPDAVFATVVWVDPGLSVEVELPEALRVAELPPTIEAPSRVTRIELQALTGASTAFGEGAAAGRIHEPEVMVAVPLELGFGVARGPGFGRVELGGAVLVGGRYLAATDDGDRISRATRLDLAVAGGVGDALRFGVAGGVQWPSRLTGRLLLGWSPTPVLLGELRVGANLTTAMDTEPAVEVLVGIRR